MKRNLIMKTSTHSRFPLIHSPRTHYSFFIVSNKSAHNSIRFHRWSFSDLQSAILNPKFPHSFRPGLKKVTLNPTITIFPLQIRRNWGGCPKGGWGIRFSFRFQETNMPFYYSQSTIPISNLQSSIPISPIRSAKKFQKVTLISSQHSAPHEAAPVAASSLQMCTSFGEGRVGLRDIRSFSFRGTKLVPARGYPFFHSSIP